LYYDRDANTWNEYFTLNYGRMEAAGTVLEDGTWWVTGGGNGTDVFSNKATTEQLTLSDGWIIKEDLPLTMQHHNVISINSTHVKIFFNMKFLLYLPVCTRCFCLEERKLVELGLAQTTDCNGWKYSQFLTSGNLIRSSISKSSKVYFQRGNAEIGLIKYGNGRADELLVAAGYYEGDYKDTTFFFNLETLIWRPGPKLMPKLRTYPLCSVMVP